MAAWPLSQRLRIGMTESYDAPVIRTQMDAGPAKMRPRTTTVVKPLTGSLVLNGTDVATLRTFYETTTVFGTEVFTWTDPVDDSAINVRFTAAPSYTVRAGSATPANRIWDVQLQLEIVP